MNMCNFFFFLKIHTTTTSKIAPPTLPQGAKKIEKKCALPLCIEKSHTARVSFLIYEIDNLDFAVHFGAFNINGGPISWSIGIGDFGAFNQN